MPSDVPSIDSAAVDGGEMAARVASGPGFWTDWLAELSRHGLLEALLADDVIARALREAPAGHRYDGVLNAKMTVVCVLVACLFPGDGYDAVLRRAFGLPGPRFRPGAGVPGGSAFSLTDRGSFSMDRFLRFSAAGAHLAWRVKNTAKSVPSGSCPTGLSWSCCTNPTA